MTTRELIAHLQTLPPDAVVIYRCCSEYTAMDADQVKAAKMRHTKDTPRLCGARTGDQTPLPGANMVYIDLPRRFEGGQYVMLPVDPAEVVECVVFPGN